MGQSPTRMRHIAKGVVATMQTSAHQSVAEGLDAVRSVDREVADLLVAENDRQQTTICLIPSENYASAAVRQALSSSLTNKYAEGYPHVWTDGGRVEKNGRYYQGQANTNAIERLAIRRTLELFTADPAGYHANVQPLSGAPANLAVLNAILRPGDVFMGMKLAHGGHLTHGHDVTVTGKYYRAVQYGLDESGAIDYEELERLALSAQPKLIFCGATAYPLQIDFERIGRTARRAGAVLVADVAHIAGLCVTGQHPHPFPHADIVTTTTHKILRGPRGGLIVSKKEFGPAIDRSVFPGLQGGPHMNSVAAIAVALKEAAGDAYRTYAAQVVANARELAQALESEGFRLVGGRTENHLILLDIVNGTNGCRAKNGSYLAGRLEKAGIVANKNPIPGDAKAWLPSGIRLGTPAVTTLGMKEAEMRQIARWIADATRHADDESRLRAIAKEVARQMATFPPPRAQ